MTEQVGPVAQSKKVGFISLGCPKALVDSERILTQLRVEGYEVAPSYEDADAVIVNTCGFITPAVEESLAAIGEALDATGKVIVTGCLGERPEKIMERHPKVAAITGSEAVDEVMGHVRELLPNRTDAFTGLIPVAAPGARPAAELPQREAVAHGDVFAPTVKLTPRHYAYVKIAEGCNHTCSFCIIPKLRGIQVSRDAGAVLYESFRLIAGGTKELMIISQDTSAYGVDLRHRESEFQGEQVRAHLGDLAVKLGEMGAWVRMHYVYPYPHVDRIVELMAQGKILPYLDVPLQHASPRILKLMRRPGATGKGAGKQLETIRRWREICPELVIRSTFIVGFPGETEEDFQELLGFLEEARLDRVGAFPYSDVDEADANRLPDPVPEEVKQERLARFMEVAQRISTEKLAEKVGHVLDVIIDEFNDDEGDVPGSKLIGRTKGDAPGIDGQVYLSAGAFTGQIKLGDIVRASIEDSDEYDLYGEVVACPEWKPNVPQLGHFGKH